MKIAKTVRLPDEAAKLLRRAAALSREPAFLVGGAPRDALLGRPTRDLDLAVRGARGVARALASELGGSFVVLDAENAVFRVALGASFRTVRQLDLAELQGATIHEDLARRDFTLNALALPLSERLESAWPASRLLDPRGGLQDLARGLLRAEAPSLFEDDPLRLLRAFRIGAQLGVSIEAKTGALIRRLARKIRTPAGERVQAELLALLAQPGAAAWLRRMDEHGLLVEVFPELAPSRECATVYYGPGGVLEHSLRTVERADFLLHGLPLALPGHASALARELRRRGQGDAPFEAVLKLAALLHDVSKPETAQVLEGRLRFFGHDAAGADKCEAIMRRLRFSRAHIDAVRAVVAHHLRPGNLAASGPLSDKAAYRFFRDLGENAVPLLLVCWADHASYVDEPLLRRSLKLAARPPEEEDAELARLRPPEARKTIHHLQFVADLLGRLFERPETAAPPRLVDGRDVMRVAGLEPGPRVGELLERVREAQVEGKVRSKEQALAFLKSASRRETPKPRKAK